MDLMKSKVCLDCTDHTEIYEGENCPVCGGSCYWWAKKFLVVQKLNEYKRMNREVNDEKNKT